MNLVGWRLMTDYVVLQLKFDGISHAELTVTAFLLLVQDLCHLFSQAPKHQRYSIRSVFVAEGSQRFRIVETAPHLGWR